MTTPAPGSPPPPRDAEEAERGEAGNATSGSAGAGAALPAAAVAAALPAAAALAGALAPARTPAVLDGGGGGALALGLLLGALVAVGAAAAALVIREALEDGCDARRRAAGAAGAARWTERWRAVLRGDAPPPSPGEADRGAAEALLALREAAPEEVAARCARLYADAGLLAADLAAIASGPPLERARALERLARLGHPDAFPALERAALHPDPGTARRALLSLARARARVRSDDDEVVASMTASIEAARAGRGAAEAALLLLGRNARPVIERMLEPGRREPRHDAALEALGKLRLDELAPLTGPWLRDRDPEVRAAAARALARLRRVPPALVPDLLDLLSDGAWFVRAQAATALAGASGTDGAGGGERIVAALAHVLGDPSWWVRRSAATALAARGPAGRGALERAATSHADPYARDAARRALEAPS